MTRTRWLPCACMLLVGLGTRAASSQTLIRVTAGEFPLGDVEVAAWDSRGRLASGRTDGLGIVRFVPARAPGTDAFLLARKIGYVQARVALAGDPVAIDLARAPATLPALAIETAPLRCPGRDDPLADSLWRAASQHYARGVSQLHLRWTGGIVEETVSADQRGYGDRADLRSAYGGVNPVAAVSSAPWAYATYERHVNLSGEYWRWRYRPLETFAAEHFVSPAFRETHNMMVLGRAADATVIGFCGRERREPYLEGELQIGADMRLRSARWFFHVPHDDEDAGAEATFGSAEFEGREYLLGVRGSSWRRAGRNLYNQTRYENETWQLSRTVAGPAPQSPKR